MRRRGPAGLRARAALEQALELIDRPPSASDLEHRPDQRTIHVSQEHVRLDPELQQIPLRQPLRAPHVAVKPRVLGLARRERSEVVLAAQRRGALRERLAVERPWPPEGTPSLEHPAAAAREHSIAVGAARERKSTRL